MPWYVLQNKRNKMPNVAGETAQNSKNPKVVGTYPNI